MLDETRVETSVLYNILPVMSKSGTDRVYIHWGERAGDHKGPLRHSSPHSPLREPNFPRKDGEPPLKHLDRSSAKEYLPFKPKSKGASGCTPPIPGYELLATLTKGTIL